MAKRRAALVLGNHMRQAISGTLLARSGQKNLGFCASINGVYKILDNYLAHASESIERNLTNGLRICGQISDFPPPVCPTSKPSANA